MFGILADINLMMWMYSGMVWSIISVVVKVMLMWATDKAYTIKEDST